MLQSEMFTAFLIIISSLTVVSTVLFWLRVPTIVGFVLTGVLIGPSCLNLISSLPAASAITEIGIALLMFSLGMEISLRNLPQMAKALFGLGFSQVAITMAIGSGVMHWLFDVVWTKAVVFGSLLALSSTAAVLKLLQEKRETESPYGRVSVSVLLFQDFAALPLMILIPFLSAGADIKGALPLFEIAWKVGAFLLACVVVGIWIVPKAFYAVAKTGSRELFFFMILTVAFVTGHLAHTVGLSMSLGAFLAGVLISESPYNKQALAELSPLRDNFLGLFFASVGLLLDLNFVFANWSQILFLIVVLFTIKFLVLYVVSRGNRYSHGVSLAAALGLSQIGEFSFVLAAAAFGNGLIENNEFQYFLALAVLSLLFTPLLFSIGIRVSAHASWASVAKELTSGFRAKREATSLVQGARDVVMPLPALERKTIVIGLGHAGRNILNELVKNGIPCEGIDFNASTIRELKDKGFPVMYGDATRPEVLESAGLAQSHLVIVAVTGKSLTANILAMIHSLHSHVKTLVRLQFIREMEEMTFRPQDQVVVAELETSRELLLRVLEHYDLGPRP